MITDLLAATAALNRAVDGELNIDDAIEAVTDTVDRDVSGDELDELRDVLEDGWLDE